MASFLVSLVVGAGIILVLFPLLVSVFNFPAVGIPDSIFSIIEDKIGYLFSFINYIFPLNFALLCITVIFLSKHANIILGLFNWIIRKLTGH